MLDVAEKELCIIYNYTYNLNCIILYAHLRESDNLKKKNAIFRVNIMRMLSSLSTVSRPIMIISFIYSRSVEKNYATFSDSRDTVALHKYDLLQSSFVITIA